MKKYLIAGTLLGLLFPLAAFASLDTNLHYGSAGQDVTALQEFLKQQNVYSGPISGNFYSLTLVGVKKFQSAEGITPVSGYVGSVTRGVINQILAGQVSSSEGNATTTKPVVDLSQQNSTAAGSTNQTFTTPSGAVIDANGNILNTPPQSAQTSPIATTPPVVAANISQANSNAPVPLTITAGQVTATQTSAYVSWGTNIPSNSKLFLTQSSSGNSPQVFPSSAGYSTQGFVNIPNLTSGTQYSYTIEAINGTQDQKLTGTINTTQTPSTPACQPNPVISTFIDEPQSTTTISRSNLITAFPRIASAGSQIIISGNYSTGCPLAGVPYTYEVDGILNGISTVLEQQSPENTTIGNTPLTMTPTNGIGFAPAQNGSPDSYVFVYMGPLLSNWITNPDGTTRSVPLPSTYEYLFKVDGDTSSQTFTYIP